MVDLAEGHDADFATISTRFRGLAASARKYGRAEVIRDEGFRAASMSSATGPARPPPRSAIRTRKSGCWRRGSIRLPASRMWSTACVAAMPLRRLLDERRARVEADRRAGFDRRVQDVEPHRGRPPHQATISGSVPAACAAPGDIDLVGAARRAREHAHAAFSHFKVGAALETADGAMITGCNIENATYGLTICAERVAMFKALSEGHRAFTRIAIVADTERRRRPAARAARSCGSSAATSRSCWPTSRRTRARIRSKDLLPLPFDARLLETAETL